MYSGKGYNDSDDVAVVSVQVLVTIVPSNPSTFRTERRILSALEHSTGAVRGSGGGMRTKNT